jgi:hypothetical protein
MEPAENPTYEDLMRRVAELEEERLRYREPKNEVVGGSCQLS